MLARWVVTHQTIINATCSRHICRNRNPWTVKPWHSRWPHPHWMNCDAPDFPAFLGSCGLTRHKSQISCCRCVHASWPQTVEFFTGGTAAHPHAKRRVVAQYNTEGLASHTSQTRAPVSMVCMMVSSPDLPDMGANVNMFQKGLPDFV